MKILGIVVLALLVAFGVLCLEAWFVMLLWNWVVVGIFGASAISFWLSFGLCLLVSILFGSKHSFSKRRD